MVAYSCRAYAMEQGISLKKADKSPEVMTFLVALMDKLEVDKKALPSMLLTCRCRHHYLPCTSCLTSLIVPGRVLTR